MICQLCAGTGSVDAGGFTPWGYAIDVACPHCDGRGKPLAVYKCPHCGWEYDPSINGWGYDLVPDHLTDNRPCPGQQQKPRNAESDKRPLWSEETPMTHQDLLAAALGIELQEAGK